MSSPQIYTGVVTHIIDKGRTRHFGFVTPDEGGKNIFLHVMDGRVFEPSGDGLLPTAMPLARAPRMGDKVVYVVDHSSDRGPKAKPWGFADGDGAESGPPTNAE